MGIVGAEPGAKDEEEGMGAAGPGIPGPGLLPPAKDVKGSSGLGVKALDSAFGVL